MCLAPEAAERDTTARARLTRNFSSPRSAMTTRSTVLPTRNLDILRAIAVLSVLLGIPLIRDLGQSPIANLAHRVNTWTRT